MSTTAVNTTTTLVEVASGAGTSQIRNTSRKIGSNDKDERRRATDEFKNIIEKLRDTGSRGAKFKEDIASPGFFDSEIYRLTNSKKDTLLHAIVAAFDPEVDDDDDEIQDGYQQDIPGIHDKECLQALVKGLVKNHSDMLLEAENKAKETPLHRAISDNNAHLVEWMFQYCDPAILPNVLAKTTEKNLNCLHLIVQSKLPVETILRFIENATEKTLTAKNNVNLTPVHLAVQYPRCFRDDWKSVIQALFYKADGALDVETTQQSNNSVFRYHEESRRKELLKSKNNRPRSDIGPHYQGTSKQRSRMPSLNRRGSNIADYDDRLDSHHYEYVQIDRSGKVVQQPLTELDANKEKDEEKKREKDRMKKQDKVQSLEMVKGKIAAEAEQKQKSEERANEIREFMKLHYLRTRDAEQAVAWLYGNNLEGIQVDFDHFEAEVGNEDAKFRQLIAKDFCEVFEHFRFDPTLKSVHFRNLQLEGGSNFAFGDGYHFQPLSKDNGRTDIVFLFDWLWHSKGVRRILEVTMEDFDDPHSDEAIEVCLEKFKIEVLDWQKVDLCPGVVSKVGSDLREISLHWSGRNAVLRGWSEPDGLIQCPKLTKINLHFPKNLATSNRTMGNISIFKERLSNLKTPNIIEVTYDHDPESSWGLPQTYNIPAPVSKNENAGQTNIQEWIRCIDSFSQKIQNVDLQKALSKEVLKTIPSSLFKDVVVAVVDDGVDIGNRNLRGKIDGGRSFDTGPQGHYRSSTNNHGTTMANMIVRVCPKAKIYVVKLQTYMSESAVHIDVQSAAKAIQAAVDHGVDIISMSWNVKKPEETTPERSALDQALKNAKDKGILLFCSSGDRGDLEPETYPGSYGVDAVFRIGAATATGKGREGTPDPNRINYLLPGFEIPERKPKGVKADLYTGSSVATALAAGLAALVHHCVRLGVIWTKTASDEERYKWGVKIDEKELDAMRSPGKAFERMNHAFQQFGLNEMNHKYIEVWKLLEKDEFVLNTKVPAERLRQIAKLGQFFIPK